MKQRALSLLALGLTLAVATTASASSRTYFGFQIGISNAPPPPRVYYRSAPPVYFEPETQVYVVRDNYADYDMFRYGGYWYVCDDDYWYRARSYGGPFITVDVRSVPTRLFEVPQRRWHRYPGGLARWHQSNGRGHGHGWGNRDRNGNDRGDDDRRYRGGDRHDRGDD
jgi:hypothetical protein